MDLPRNWTEYTIWVGIQFPVLIAAAWIARWAIRESGRQYRERAEEVHRLYTEVLTEKERRIEERDARVRQLERELADLRAKHSRSKKPEAEP